MKKIVFLICILLFGFDGNAQTPKGAKEEIPVLTPWDESKWTKVIQDRQYEKSSKHIFSLYGGVIPNDDLFWVIPIGGRYGYFFTETIAVEVSGAYQFSFGNNMKSALEPDTWRYFNPYMALKWYANVGGLWYPIYGKMALLGSNLGHFDIGIKASIGAIGAKMTKFEKDYIKHKWVTDFAGQFGFDAITYLSRYIGLRTTLTIFMFDSEGKNLFLPVELSFGLTFFAPGLGRGN